MKEGGAGRRRSAAESPDNGNKCGSMPPCIRFGLPPHYSSIICMRLHAAIYTHYSYRTVWHAIQLKIGFINVSFYDDEGDPTVFVPYFNIFKIYILIYIL
jgi:hypothetical protein